MRPTHPHRRVWPTVARVAGAVGVVGLTTGALELVDADLTLALLVLLVVVVGASALGYAPGIAAAVVAFIALTYRFTSPVNSFRIDQFGDLVSLIAFVAVAIVVGALVARLNALRQRSARATREAQVRLELTGRLLAGDDPEAVVAAMAGELVTLFDLASCTITSREARHRAEGPHVEIARDQVSNGSLVVDLGLGRSFAVGERASIEALALGLATALDRMRLDREGRETRLQGEIDHTRASFLTAITHDLRTPLATIRAATGALRVPNSALDEGERDELLDLAHGEAARLESLVTKVLNLSRIRAGVRPTPVAVGAEDLARAAVERLGRGASDRAIDLDVPTELPAAWADPLMIEEVVVNLLENALRYAPAQSAITIQGACANDQLELRIIDRGPGIPEEARERAFEEFVRLPNAAPSPGTGLGLAIARALTEANGGRVWYEETSGGGATLVMSLPIEPTEGSV